MKGYLPGLIETGPSQEIGIISRVLPQKLIVILHYWSPFTYQNVVDIISDNVYGRGLNESCVSGFSIPVFSSLPDYK